MQHWHSNHPRWKELNICWKQRKTALTVWKSSPGRFWQNSQRTIYTWWYSTSKVGFSYLTKDAPGQLRTAILLFLRVCCLTFVKLKTEKFKRIWDQLTRFLFIWKYMTMIWNENDLKIIWVSLGTFNNILLLSHNAGAVQTAHAANEIDL